MSMVYQWKSGSRFPIGAQIAAERLRQIKGSCGEITPRRVVDDATDEQSPLHRCFEWDDAKAADNYRLHQARVMISCICVAKVEDSDVGGETRAFVHTEIGSPRYEPIDVAMSQPDMRAELFEKARHEITQWKLRYASYSAFSKIVSAIDETLADESAAA